MLEFLRHGHDLHDANTGLFWEWYRGTVVEGVFVGRFSHSQQSAQQPDLTHFRSHVTGWNSTFLDRDIVPRSYDVTIQKDHHARLRIDRLPTGQFIGRLKVYAVGDENEQEEFEYDLEVTQWDGKDLSFTRYRPDGT